MTFKELENALEDLMCLENVDTSVIGYSVFGRPIRAFHVGDYSDNQVIITGAIHAREWITALLVVELVKICAAAKLSGGGIYFIPLCNPDGVKISLGGKSSWKANGRGVDLNVNFDADWGHGAQNKFEAGSENFVGPCSNSEPETRALISFTKRIKPKATVAYHSKGEVIYYGFEPLNGNTTKAQLLRDFELAKKIGELTGYKPIKTENSTGGYSDWVSMHMGVPALTVEVGNDNYSHPIGADKLSEIFDQNIDVPKVLLKIFR